MTLDEIKTAVDEGKIVYWKNPMYLVKKNGVHYDVECQFNGDTSGLTWQDGATMDYDEGDFFIEKSDPASDQ